MVQYFEKKYLLKKISTANGRFTFWSWFYGSVEILKNSESWSRKYWFRPYIDLYSTLVSKMWNDGLVIGYLSKFHTQEALSMAVQNNFYGLAHNLWVVSRADIF